MVPPLACVAAVGQLPAVWPAQTPPQLSEIYHFKLCPSQFITDKLKSVLSCKTGIQDYCVIFFLLLHYGDKNCVSWTTPLDPVALFPKLYCTFESSHQNQNQNQNEKLNVVLLRL